ncbi:MAG: VCBS repeat-containing protein, partial [Cytophagia bacterium]|nr:VCBS repeat-containing protein [Cytophagia bacterium]
VTVSDDEDPVVITQDVTVYLDENGNASISPEQIDNGSTDNSGGQLSFSLDQSTFDCDDLGARNEATIVSDNTWSQSTESINTPQPFASVISSLPAASTYTLGATVDDPYGQDNFFSPAIPGAQAIRSFGYMKFFRNNFELTGRPQSLRLRARVDNVMEIFINGVSIGYEGDFDGANFSGPVYHDLFIDGNGVQNGYEEGMKFDKVTSASILDLLQAGDNEIVFAIGNSNNNTDDGGFMVRMDAVADGVPVELTVTDPSGNTSTGQAFVVVKDEIDPTITLNGDAVVQHEAYTAYTDLGATASDNCSANLTTDNPVDVNTPGSYTVTYTALDGSGNETIATRTVQIVDSTDPEVLVKKITIELDANGQVTIAGIDVDNGSNDASGISSYELSQYTFGCDDLGDNGVTLTVTDNNGRTASAITTVIVEDNIAPTAITQNITVYLDENGNASITPDQINNGSFDNCEVENLTLDIDSFTCDDLGENTVTLTAWDGPVGDGLTGFQLDQSRPSSINFGPATGYSVLSADMNGDGNIDLIYGGYCGYQNEVRISDGNGNFTVIPFGTNAGGDCVEQIDVADVDGDGDIDVVVSRPARVFLNDGNGNLTESQVIGGARKGINLADYDGDGDVDLAYGGPGAPSIYKNNGSGNFTLFSTIAGSYGENDYYEDGDIDGDGDIDLIIAQRASNNQPPNDVYINDGNGNFTAKGLNLGTNSYSKPLVQDLDGDGDLDLVFANNNASQPTPVWFNDGAGNFTNVQNIAPNTSTFGIRAGDLDLDGDIDLYLGNNGPNEAWLNDGTGTFVASGELHGTGLTWDVVLGDFDNNGSLDAATMKPDGQLSSNVWFNQATPGSNNGSATAIVTVVDAIDPTVVGKNISVTLTASGTVSIAPEDVLTSGSDNCGPVTYSINRDTFGANDALNSPVTVQLTGTDPSGNETSVAVQVTVIDPVPTVITKDITVYLDASGNVTIAPEDVDDGSSSLVGLSGLSLDITSFNCSNVGNNTVTLTATSTLGSEASGTANVYVADEIAPVITVQNATVQLDQNGYGSIQLSDILTSATDNCGIASSTATDLSFDCSEVGDNTVTVTVTDVNGRVTQADVTVTVLDVLPIIAEADSFTLDTCEPITFTAAQLLGNDSDPYGETLKIDFVGQPSSGTIQDNGNGTYTYTPGQSTNHVATAEYLVKRDDGTIVFSGNGHFYEFVPAPGITWSDAKAAAEARTYNGQQGYLVTITSSAENDFAKSKLQGQGWIGANDSQAEGEWRWVTGPEAGTLFYTKSAGAVNGAYNNWAGGEPNDYTTSGYFVNGEDVAHFLSDGRWNDYPNDIGTSIAGYVVEYGGSSEDCNIQSTTTGTITFELNDTVAPNAIAQNITIDLDANGNASITADMIDAGSNDACGIASYALSQYDFDCSNVGANTVTLTVTDVNNNVSTATATVTVRDVTAAQVITQDITVELDVNGNASITTGMIDNGSNDACGIASYALSQYDFDCSHVGANTVTLTVTDNNGNVSTGTATVTVEDKIAAEVITQNITVQLDATGNASITSGMIDNGSNDACGIASYALNQYDFDCSHVGANTVTLTVTDVNGNVNQSTATVTVRDVTAAEVITQDITVELDANGSASITTSDIDNGSNDACGIASYELDITSFDCNDTGANTVTLTVTDVNGNVSSATATVTVIDVIAPTVITQDITIQL